MTDLFKARDSLQVGDKQYTIYRLDALEKAGLTQLKRLPFSIRIVLEAALRQCNDKEITQNDVKNIAAWTAKGNRPGIPFLPARVVMQDFTGVPAIVDRRSRRRFRAWVEILSALQLSGPTPCRPQLLPVDRRRRTGQEITVLVQFGPGQEI